MAHIYLLYRDTGNFKAQMSPADNFSIRPALGANQNHCLKKKIYYSGKNKSWAIRTKRIENNDTTRNDRALVRLDQTS